MTGALGAVGVITCANILNRPLSRPETMPLFDLMADPDLPVRIHPIRCADCPDYKEEPKRHYEIWWIFGRHSPLNPSTRPFVSLACHGLSFKRHHSPFSDLNHDDDRTNNDAPNISPQTGHHHYQSGGYSEDPLHPGRPFQ